MKDILSQKNYSHTWFQELMKSRDTLRETNNRRESIFIISLLGAWIVSFPYEGQLLYTLAKNYSIEISGLLDISLVLQVVGLILGGIFLRGLKPARKTIILAVPVCILCTVTFFFPSYYVWMVTLTVCSTIAGMCITAFGYFFKNFVVPDNRFRTAAIIIININILKMLVNNISLYISIQAGFIFTIIMLGAAWLLTFRIPFREDKKLAARDFDKKTGFKALILLFLFIAIISIDFGIMIEKINPKYTSSGWLSSWYWLLPYLGAALIMKNLKNTDDRSNVLYVAVGMIGFGFILFLILDYSVSSFLIVNLIMMGAWAVSDIFWWSILLEMLEMVKSSAIILSVGFSGVMIGVLAGKIIANSNPIIIGSSLSIVSMAVVCLTLFILPILHSLLSRMIKKNAAAPINFPDSVDTLTEREKQIAALLLKGRTCKLIAAELYLSENTVKTHIKNIYSKLGVKSKSELFNFKTE